MLTPFPYDVVGAWTARNNVQLSKEAFEDLIEQFWTFGREEQEDITNVTKEWSGEEVFSLDTWKFDEPVDGITNVTKEL